jgi:hypothetical protein
MELVPTTLIASAMPETAGCEPEMRGGVSDGAHRLGVVEVGMRCPLEVVDVRVVPVEDVAADCRHAAVLAWRTGKPIPQPVKSDFPAITSVPARHDHCDVGEDATTERES